MPVIKMTGLNSYAEEGNSAQKQTHITIPNPSHEDNDNLYADEEDVQRHFDAANAVQNSNLDRKRLVGDYLSAVSEAQNGNFDALEDLFDTLTAEDEE